MFTTLENTEKSKLALNEAELSSEHQLICRGNAYYLLAAALNSPAEMERIMKQMGYSL